MAKIVKTSAQEDALKKINGNIKLLVGVNAVLNCKSQKGSMTMAFGKTKASIPMDKADSDEMLGAIRKKLASEVKALSKKYAIVLDEEDEAVLANREEEKEEKEAEKQPEVESEDAASENVTDTEKANEEPEERDHADEPTEYDDDDYPDETETVDADTSRSFY